jgi:hypothetical protein
MDDQYLTTCKPMVMTRLPRAGIGAITKGISAAC